MSTCLEAFETEMNASPESVDRFFKNGKFDIAALLAGAEECGYEMGEDDLVKIDDEVHHKPLTASIALLIPDAKTGEMTELTVDEIELVAAASSIYSYVNSNININVNVVVVAAAIALVIAAVGVFVFI